LAEFSVNVQNLTKKFDDFIAVNNISFQIPKGSIFGFLGPNGAGKSTTIRMLLGIILPTEGSGTVLNFDIKKDPEKIKSHAGYMSQKFSLYHDLTVLENLDFFAGIFSLTGEKKRKRINYLLDMARLREHKDQLAFDLSRGVQQRLSLAVSLIQDPPLIFLDEPTSGVDPALRRYFWDMIVEMSREGKTIMVTSHYMDEVERCDEICFIYQGKLIARGKPQELKDNYVQGALYSIESKNRIDILDRIEKVSWIDHPFPSGIFVRFLVKDKTMGFDIVKNEIELLGISSLFLKKDSPTLEDVFVSLVTGSHREGIS
jgi:ABC-2 type transport system ATP-binding protein